MTHTLGDFPVDQAPGAPKLGRCDPLLQELWAAKAALNAAADYRVDRLAARAMDFDLDAALAQLGKKTGH